MRNQVSEKCGCGAEFSWAGEYTSSGKEAASEWRKEHRHIETADAGICGEAHQQTVCRLNHGHLGWHSDKRGTDWGYPRWSTGAGKQP